MEHRQESSYLRVVRTDAEAPVAERAPLHVDRFTSSPETAHAGGVWFQILAVITDLQLAIADHQRERKEFEQWAARERAFIARERSALGTRHRSNHRFW